jgi:hypothetical protein
LVADEIVVNQLAEDLGYSNIARLQERLSFHLRLWARLLVTHGTEQAGLYHHDQH